MSSNYSIIIDKLECHADYGRHIFRDILSRPNSTFNCFMKRTKDDWDTGRQFPAGEIINNSTKMCNNMVSAK